MEIFILEESTAQTSTNLLSPLIRISEPNSSIFNISTNDEQSTWRPNILKYHIESLLQ